MKNSFKTDIINSADFGFRVLSFNVEEGERQFYETETLTSTFYKFKKYKNTVITFNCYLKAKDRAELIDKFSNIKKNLFKNTHSELYINNYPFYYKINKIEINNKKLLKTCFLQFDIVFTCNYFKYKKTEIPILNNKDDYSIQDIDCTSVIKLKIERDNKDEFDHKQTVTINNNTITFNTKKSAVTIDLDNKSIVEDDTEKQIMYSGEIFFNNINELFITIATDDLAIKGTLIISEMIY